MAAAILSSLHRKSLPPFLQLLRLRFFSDSSASSDPHFMVDYLMESCGFSAANAAKVSKHFAHLRSSEKPDAVLGYLRSQGFGADHLRKIITQLPRCLCFNVKITLAPKLEFLRSMGFSESDVVNVLVAQPNLLTHSISRSIRPKLEMWESLIGSRELLLKHIRHNKRFLCSSIEKKLSPNIEFLTDECRVPKETISLIVRNKPGMIILKQDALRALAVTVEGMGTPRGSKMFMWMIYFLCMVSKGKFEATLKLMRQCGWSDDEFYSAIKRQPSFLSISNKLLQERMDFFVKEVGCTPSYIAERPKMLSFSMEKRVLPRVRVMKMLKSKGLWDGQLELSVSSLLSLSDAKFIGKFVHPYEKKDSKLRIQNASDGR